jgi:hypothetical protein
MTKKNGDVLVFIGASIISFSLLYLFNKTKRNINHQPDSVQMSNRFVEFFDKDYILKAYEQYSKYIDMGISPQGAFEMTIKES